jgi:hypothetical protein
MVLLQEQLVITYMTNVPCPLLEAVLNASLFQHAQTFFCYALWHLIDWIILDELSATVQSEATFLWTKITDLSLYLER